jgi:ParB-like chromosome segregation protein Spo0J
VRNSLPIENVHLRSDARAINADAVLGLSESIADVGLINPIRVRAIEGGWEVIAGAHRLAACKGLGLVEIEAEVVTDDDLHAELAMIDENLCRAELSPAERARQTARRRAIYQELHPETKRGGDHKSGAAASITDSFTEQTAKATGRSEQTIYREASRGARVIGEVIDVIKGTSLDTGSYLDKLAKLPPNDQMKAATRDLAFASQRQRQDERAKIEAAKRSKLDADIKDRADKANAELLAEYLPADAWDAFKANLSVGSVKGLLAHFTNITGQSIIDRGAA